jgi:myo-inositol 2-dehydrogenase/D-chiro-inositol 1-dehydrogenase
VTTRRSSRGEGESVALGVGIIGCGRATAELHLPALARLPGLRVAALCDADTPRLDQVVARCPGAARHAQARDLIADSSVAVVLVAMPAAGHHDAFVAAMEAGRHVYVEKPLALELEQADRMVAVAAAARGRAVVGFNLRSHRLVRAAWAHVRAGDLGRVVSLRTILVGGLRERRAWQQRRAQGGGALYELGSHHFDLWRFLLESEVAEVRAQSVSNGADDATVSVSGRLESGVLVASMLALRGTATHEVEIVGERAALRFSLYRGDSLEIRPAGRAAQLGGWLRQLPAAAAAARRGGDYLDSYRVHWQRFLEHLRGGGEAPATIEDGRRSLRITRAALDAAAGRLA